MRLTIPAVSTFVVLSASMLMAIDQTAAYAQDALGTGTALDANLGVGSGGVNQARPGDNFRDRNLIITGNVVGGRGFRGSVGYSAERDFRGSLGSNDLYNFRAGSAYSSPELFRMGSTFEQLRFGQDMGVIEYRRSGTGISLGAVKAESADGSVVARVSPIAIDAARLRLDRTSFASSSAVNPQTSSAPTLVGMRYDQEGRPLVFNASSLRGITLERADQSLDMIGLTSLDAARVREDMDKGQPAPTLGAPFQTRFTAPVVDAAATTSTVGEAQRVDTTYQADYGKILERVADRYSRASNVDVQIEPKLLEQLGGEYKRLKDRLSGRADEPPQAGGVTADAPAGTTDPSGRAIEPAPPGDPAAPTRTPATRRPGAAERPAAPGSREPTGAAATTDPARLADPKGGRPPETLEPSPLDPSYLADILRHGQKIESLAGPNKDRFNELLASAEEKFKAGDYMTAERRFERALRFTPGHPLATVGAAHAQLGAGLYLSSALTLRQLFSQQPEMIDATYSEDLLPPRERLDTLVSAIRKRLESPADRGAYGFLLAYLGRQMNDVGLISEGLEIMADAEPDSVLLPLLREVWQGKDKPAEPGK